MSSNPRSVATLTALMTDPAEERPKAKPRRRLSPLRVVVALTLIGVSALLATAAYGRLTADKVALPDLWFAPYVDVTLVPRFPFEDPRVNPAQEVVLSFIVADPDNPCLPSWGGVNTLDEAFTQLDLDRRVERVRRWGGNVIVSLGGQRNDELAITCEDETLLAAAYGEIVERYDLSTLDLDIEGAALADKAAVARRSAAIKVVQDTRRAQGRDLAIWLTLPVAPRGMTADSIASIDGMLAVGVDLTGVNLMVMNFAQSREDSTMQEAVVEALDSAHLQLRNAYRRAGLELGEEQLWSKLGATPMIGQNDVASDVFDLLDAEALLALQDERPIGRISFWSLDRDTACGPNVDPRSVSNHCSGILQQPYAFSQVFEGIEGLSSEAAEAVTVAVAPQDIVDDPTTSPFPVWNEERAYPEEKRVVWRENVYQAKWWTLGDVPDDPVVNDWETPWRLLGPVLPTDTPATTTTVPAGIYEEWTGTVIYLEGSRVLWRGVAYEAKWWNSGEQPGIDVPNEWDTPWRALDASEIDQG